MQRGFSSSRQSFFGNGPTIPAVGGGLLAGPQPMQQFHEPLRDVLLVQLLEDPHYPDSSHGTSQLTVDPTPYAKARVLIFGQHTPDDKTSDDAPVESYWCSDTDDKLDSDVVVWFPTAPQDDDGYAIGQPQAKQDDRIRIVKNFKSGRWELLANGQSDGIRQDKLTATLAAGDSSSYVYPDGDTSKTPEEVSNRMGDSGLSGAICITIPDPTGTDGDIKRIILRVAPQTKTFVVSEQYDAATGKWQYKTQDFQVQPAADPSDWITLVQGTSCVSSTALKDTTTTLAIDKESAKVGEPFTLTATVAKATETDEGEPTGWVVFFDSSLGRTLGTALLSGDTATLTTAIPKADDGQHILAQYQGDSEFNSSQSTATDIDIQKADTTITIACEPSEITYGEDVTLHAIIAVTSPGNTGSTDTNGTVTFKNGDTTLAVRQIAGLECFYVTRRISGGETTVTAEYSGDVNFNSSTSDAGDLTVNKKDLTVIAQNATRAQGTGNPTFKAKYTGFANGETVDALTGAPSLTCSADTGSDPGTYPITAAVGSLTSDNYNFASFVDATLTVI